MNDLSARKVRFSIDPCNFSVFWGIFSYGFEREVRIGCSLLDLLCGQIGISETYLNDHVQTIFLNGRAIDDLSSEIVEDNAVIALSAAMPGLVGAVFRKGGILASLRSGIENQGAGRDLTIRNGHVALKFFNRIASDLGSDFLKQGICLKGEHFNGYLSLKQSLLKSVCREVTVNGKKYELDDVLTLCRPDEAVFLTVEAV